MRYNRTAIILVFIASLSHAQDTAPSEREMIQQLVQQVTVLQEQVRVLESQQRANGPPLPMQLLSLRAPPLRKLPTTLRNLLLSSKNFMNSTEFNGEGSEKSTTKS